MPASPLAFFDPDKHHIGLSEVGVAQDSFGFLTSGSYSRGYRREKESEFDGVRYGGGDSLVNKPGVSSWSMDDFTGGIFQYVWGKDQAMFARSKNALPSQFDRSARSVPPLQQWLNGTRIVTTENPLLVCAYGGYLHAAFQGSFHRWNLATGAHTSAAPGGAGSIYRAAFLRDRGHILHSVDDVISAFDLDVFVGFSWTAAPPTGAVGDVTGLSGTGDQLVAAFDDVLWAVSLPDTRTSPPNAADWYRLGRLPGQWASGGQTACWSGGLLYILLSGSDTPTQLVAFDGSQILPITDFPYNFVGQSLCSYGGRLYVGGSGADVQTGAGRYAELYEVTGSSLRLLKTFAPEQLGGGDVYGTTIPALVVHEGLLFFGIKGLGLIAYDLSTDSFFGASGFAPADASADFRHLTSGRESLFAWVYPITGASGESGWFRPATSQETVSSYTTEIETSDFTMAFDRTKRWRQLRALVRFAAGTLTLQYSTNGGLTWSSSLSPTTETNGRFRLETFDLSEVPDSRMIRFKFLMPNGTDVSAFREFVAFTASFRMLDSDSVGSGQQEKLAWTFVICGADLVEAADGSTLQQDVDQIRRVLWHWARGRKQLYFRDLDGDIFTVEIDTIEETQPVVLPSVQTDDLPYPLVPRPAREAFYRITLVEA